MVTFNEPQLRDVVHPWKLAVVNVHWRAGPFIGGGSRPGWRWLVFPSLSCTHLKKTFKIGKGEWNCRPFFLSFGCCRLAYFSSSFPIFGWPFYNVKGYFYDRRWGQCAMEIVSTCLFSRCRLFILHISFFVLVASRKRKEQKLAELIFCQQGLREFLVKRPIYNCQTTFPSCVVRCVS